MVKYRTGETKSHPPWVSPAALENFIPADAAPTPQALDSSLRVGGRGGVGAVGAKQQASAAGETQGNPTVIFK